MKKRICAIKTTFKKWDCYWCLIKEAEHGQSKADFLNKMNIALKEANETEYCLMLLKDTDYISVEQFNSISADCISILKLLISIVKSTKQNLKNNTSIVNYQSSIVNYQLSTK